MRDRTGRTARHITVAAIAVIGLGACSSEPSGTANVAGSVASQATLGPTPPTTTLQPGTTSSPAVQLVDIARGVSLAADPSVAVIDVRTPAEFAEGHIERAELVDFEAAAFGDQIAQFDRTATYLVYCHSGNRSGQATAMMAGLGFTTVYDLQGGISAWQQAGAPVVK